MGRAGLIVAMLVLAGCEYASNTRAPARATSPAPSEVADSGDTPWGMVMVSGPGPARFAPCEATISPASAHVLSMSWDACTAASHQQIKAVSSQTEDGEARISVRHYSMVDGRLVIYSYECNASKSCNGGNGMSWNRQTRSLTLRESRLELFNSGGVQRIPLAEHLTGTLSY